MKWLSGWSFSKHCRLSFYSLLKAEMLTGYQVYVGTVLGPPFTQSGDISHMTPLLMAPGFNRYLSKGLIYSEYLMWAWQVGFVLFINSD